jgi:hypothetical protein
MGEKGLKTEKTTEKKAVFNCEKRLLRGNFAGENGLAGCA